MILFIYQPYMLPSYPVNQIKVWQTDRQTFQSYEQAKDNRWTTNRNRFPLIAYCSHLLTLANVGSSFGNKNSRTSLQPAEWQAKPNCSQEAMVPFRCSFMLFCNCNQTHKWQLFYQLWWKADFPKKKAILIAIRIILVSSKCHYISRKCQGTF